MFSVIWLFCFSCSWGVKGFYVQDFIPNLQNCFQLSAPASTNPKKKLSGPVSSLMLDAYSWWWRGPSFDENEGSCVMKKKSELPSNYCTLGENRINSRWPQLVDSSVFTKLCGLDWFYKLCQIIKYVYSCWIGSPKKSLNLLELFSVAWRTTSVLGCTIICKHFEHLTENI